MKHYLVQITYRVPIERIDQALAAHRAFLQTGYERGLLLCSGPLLPRSGGVLIARGESLTAIEQFVAQDPFQLQELANYAITEFQPVKYQPWAADWFAGD